MLSTGISDSSDATFLTADSSENATFAGNLTVTGNLTVSGTQTVVSSSTQTIADPLIELNTGAGSNANDLGFVFERGSTGDNACLIWDESADSFAVGTTTATGTSTGNMTFTTGAFTAGSVIVDELTINADTITATDDFIIDAVGDITLDADGGDVLFKDGGTEVGRFLLDDSNHFKIKSIQSDADILLQGNDGGSGITALRFDMSAAGNATFNGTITSGSHIVIPATSRLYLDGSGNTFIEETAADTVTITTNNSERFRINSAGSVGISNTIGSFHSSVLPLIVGSGSGDEGMAIFSGNASKGKLGFADSASDDSGSYRGYLQYDHSGDNLNIGTAGSERMRIDSSGRVLLQHTASIANASLDDLEVGSGSGNTGMTIYSGTSSYGGIAFADGNTGATDQYPGLIEFYHNDNSMRLYTANTERFKIDNTGNSTFTGGATTNLNIAADSGTNAGQVNITCLTDGTSALHSIAEIRMQQGSGDEQARKGEILFRVSDNGGPGTAMTVSNNGNVGIGATSGGDRLEVHGGHFTIKGPSTSAQITLKESDGTINGYVYGHGTGPAVGFLDADGHWTYKHTHDTDHRWYVDNSTKGILNSSGVLSVTSVTETSDYRLKDSIYDMTELAVPRINALRPRRFNWRDTGEADEGFIAHELAEKEPNLVHGEKDGEDNQTVAYGRLTTLLVKAIQELSQEKADREQEITLLENRIEAIEQRLI